MLGCGFIRIPEGSLFQVGRWLRPGFESQSTQAVHQRRVRVIVIRPLLELGAEPLDRLIAGYGRA